jgi:hypothetical protein
MDFATPGEHTALRTAVADIAVTFGNEYYTHKAEAREFTAELWTDHRRRAAADLDRQDPEERAPRPVPGLLRGAAGGLRPRQRVEGCGDSIRLPGLKTTQEEEAGVALAR